MSEKDIKNQSRTDWARLETMTDEEIDYSDIPPLDDSFFKNARLYIPGRAVILDADILAWFQNQEEEYQRLINTVLRDYMKQQDERLLD